MQATADVSSAVSSERSKEPWGALALIQIVAFFVIGVLLWESLREIHTISGPAALRNSTLLQISQYVQSSLIQRINHFLSPEYGFASINLGEGVATWGLVSILGNLISAVLLFIIAAKTSNRWLGAFTIAFSVAAIFLSVIATPLVFGVVTDARGNTLPIDVSVISFFLFLAYLMVDALSSLTNTGAERGNFATLILGIDLPCLAATALFIVCNYYGRVPAQFSVGASAGLLAVYSVAFVLYCIWFWTRTQGGETLMKMARSELITGIAIGAVLNGGLGWLVQLLKLPIYVDLVGSIYVALLFGPVVGILAAILGSALLGIFTTPITMAYVGTAVGVTFCAWYLKRWGYGQRWLPTMLLGALVLGPLSSLLSVPITTYLFSGITFTGSDWVTALLRQSGLSLWTSVLTGALFFDSIDKLLARIIAYSIYLRAPMWLRRNQAP